TEGAPHCRRCRLSDETLNRGPRLPLSEKVRVRLIQGDVCDPSELLEAARGVNLIIHTAALIDIWGRNPSSKIWAVNYQGTWNVIEACKELGIQYLIHTSSMEVVGPNLKGDHFIRGNEETVYNVQHEGPYAQSKAEAETLVLKANSMKVAGGKTLVTCVLRPTGVYGENNVFLEDQYRLLVKIGRQKLRIAGKEVEHGRVYVGNVAWMHLLAARSLQRRPDLLGGEAYFCYDDSPYLSYEDFDMLFLAPCRVRLVGRQPLVPWFALYLLAWLAEFLQWLLRPFTTLDLNFNRYALAVVTTSFTVRTDKASRHFGYRPLFPWAESRARTARWLEALDAEDVKSQ
ncbi:3 beta-hydroxysteroid dehydrogenase type 7-like, partial [Heptranchias perlo]|uniref:3 beta-hydroxysteroid dehydrogenase type 7-like n=1 Tax=Heptranchias perlo TaxID=212740 RepID=UPI0035594E5B